MKTSPRFRTAFSRAVEILEKAGPQDVVEAYRVLVERQSEIGYPVHYGLARKAYRKYLSRKGKRLAAAANRPAG